MYSEKNQIGLFESPDETKSELDGPSFVTRHRPVGTPPTVIDLFSGCGGLSRGFMDAGFEVLLGVDHDDAALRTFAANHGNARALKCDLFESGFERQISDTLKDTGALPQSWTPGATAVDVIVAGPPCQGFSLTGPRNFDDPRNQLYLAVFQAVAHLRPIAFIIENVKGMKTLYKGQIKDEISRRFTELGYRVTPPEILNAADYGVPQIRERLFFVGILEKLGVQYHFPSPTHTSETYITCEDAIGDLPSRELEFGEDEDTFDAAPFSHYQAKMREGSSKLFNHVATRHTDLVKEVIRQVPEGRNFRSLPPGVGESRKFNEAWTRYHSKKPSRTIDTGHRNHFHYKWHRVPTVRENARLQSFPDSFRFLGTRTQQNRQVGNAVPPLLAYQLALQLKRTLCLE